MNIAIITNGINDLWYWTYGLVAGWGISFTLVVIALVAIGVRLIRAEQKLKVLESRIFHAERDYNLTINNWKDK
jgi:hypothetical protein